MKIRNRQGQSQNNNNTEEKLCKDAVIQEYLDANYQFRANVINHTTYFKDVDSIEWKELNDRGSNSIAVAMSVEYNRSIPTESVEKIINSDYVPEYNPIRDYLQTISIKYRWDNKTDHILQLFTTLSVAVDDELSPIIFKKWMVSTVAMWLEKEVNEVALILKGPQYIGKSRWVRKLCPIPNYIYTGIINPEDKDSKIIFSENLMVNLEEMPSRKGEQNFLKQLLSNKDMKVRRSYGRRHENFIRRAAVIGSTNDLELLSDFTGNRRHYVMEVTAPDYSYPVELRDKAFAQALSLFQSGFQYWFTKQEAEDVNQVNNQYMVANQEDELLDKLFEPAPDGRMTATDIKKIMDSEVTGNNVMRIGRALIRQHYGFVKGPTRRYQIRKKEEIYS